MKKSIYIFMVFFLSLFWKINLLQAQIGLLNATNDLAFSSASTYEAELKDLTGAGIGHDQVAVVNNLTLAGTLDILLSGYTPEVGDVFNIMTYGGTLSGTFATINWPAAMTAQNWTIDYGIINPGEVVIYSSAGLPIALLSFDVAQKNGKHLLTWSTALETENDHFVVEHSTDGKLFAILGTVAGNGNSATEQQYSFVHQPTKSGDHYYRIQQVDWNGKTAYSPTVTVAATQESTVSFFPNPTNGNITFSEPVNGIMVFNLLGEQVLEINATSNTFDLSSLPTGYYSVKSQAASTVVEQLIIKK